MKKILFVVVPLLFISALVFAQDVPYTYHLNGTVVDRDFAAKHKDDMNIAIATYTKTDALQPSAIASGYGILVEDGYMLFDKESNAKVVEYLKKPDTTLVVGIETAINEDYAKGDNLISIVSIGVKGLELVE